MTTSWKWIASGNNSNVWINNNPSARSEVPKLSDGLTNRVAGNDVIISNEGNFGLGVSNPTEKINISGNVKFSGAVMPNNFPGTVGQVLVCSGAELAASWGIAPTWINVNNYALRSFNTSGSTVIFNV